MDGSLWHGHHSQGCTGPVPAAKLNAATLCWHAKQTDFTALQQRFGDQDILRTSQASVSLAPYSMEHFTPALHQCTLSMFGGHSEDGGLAADSEPFPRHTSLQHLLSCTARAETTQAWALPSPTMWQEEERRFWEALAVTRGRSRAVTQGPKPTQLLGNFSCVMHTLVAQLRVHPHTYNFVYTRWLASSKGPYLVALVKRAKRYFYWVVTWEEHDKKIGLLLAQDKTCHFLSVLKHGKADGVKSH